MANTLQQAVELARQVPGFSEVTVDEIREVNEEGDKVLRASSNHYKSRTISKNRLFYTPLKRCLNSNSQCGPSARF